MQIASFDFRLPRCDIDFFFGFFFSPTAREGQIDDISSAFPRDHLDMDMKQKYFRQLCCWSVNRRDSRHRDRSILIFLQFVKLFLSFFYVQTVYLASITHITRLILRMVKLREILLYSGNR